VSERCKAESYHERTGFLPCINDAVRDGYCGVHHPDSVAKRKAKADARYAAKLAQWDRIGAREREQSRKAAAYDELHKLARDLAVHIYRTCDGNTPWAFDAAALLARAKDAGLLDDTEELPK
jgi:hypothetical protein